MATDRTPIATVTRKMQSELNLEERDLWDYVEYMKKHYSIIDSDALKKSNSKSAFLRQIGNRLFLDKRFLAALEKYNEAICYAESGSDHLSLGYANRSAVYYEMREYHYSIYNISLARPNYPEKFLPKLAIREEKCRANIAAGLTEETDPDPRWTLTGDVNPRIPFLASGITMEQFPEFGRGLVAQRDFQTGEVILIEKPVLATIEKRMKYLNCNHCSKAFQHSLIPCPACVTAMYCGVECLERDKKYVHRFECAVSSKLDHVAFKSSSMAHRFFFYGLTLFDDDLQAMMEYCERTADTGGNPFLLDYTNYDPLAEFKELHKTKMTVQLQPDAFEIGNRAFAAAYYVLLHPQVESIAKTDAQRNFMLNTLRRYHVATMYLALDFENFKGEVINFLCSISSLINHSCDQNVMLSYGSDTQKCVVSRPIRKGEQLLFSFGSTWKNPVPLRAFECRCNVCRYDSIVNWFSTGRRLPEEANDDLMCIEIFFRCTVDRVKELLFYMRRFVEQFAYVHPEKRYCKMHLLYCKMLGASVAKELQTLDRAKVATMVG